MSRSGDPADASGVPPPTVRGRRLLAELRWLAGWTLLAFAAVAVVGGVATRSGLRRIEEESLRQRVERTRLLLLRQGEIRSATLRE
jgi:hypothetical protein